LAAVFHFPTGGLRKMMFDRTPKITGEWECMECGYIEEGVRSRRPAVCSECGAPENAFEFFPYEAYDQSDEEDWDSDDLDDDSGEHNEEEDDY
jgi:hypothetical protein